MFKIVGDMSQQIGKEASWYHGLKSLWDEMSSFEKIVVPMGWNVCTNILGGILWSRCDVVCVFSCHNMKLSRNSILNLVMGQWGQYLRSKYFTTLTKLSEGFGRLIVTQMRWSRHILGRYCNMKLSSNSILNILIE